MKSEKEITEALEKLKSEGVRIGNDTFSELNTRGEHWLDCLEWILDDGKYCDCGNTLTTEEELSAGVCKECK